MSHKVVSSEQFIDTREQLRKDGESLVHCHGCFDIVHPGHIRHLRQAASQGDRLLVSITADPYVNKGPGRPMFSHKLRAENLSELECVDYVIINHNETAVSLLERVRPDVYIKGAEYSETSDPRFLEEERAVQNGGGRVVFSSGDVVFSSTSLIAAVRSASEPIVGDAGAGLSSHDTDLSARAIDRHFESVRGKHVMVVGETILDVYQYCNWPETAQEHPMISLRPDKSEQFDGGSAVISLHLAAMGCNVSLLTPMSLDKYCKLFHDRMRQHGVEVLPILAEQPIAKKTRFLVGMDKIMKVDSPISYQISSDQRHAVMQRIQNHTHGGALVVADFGLGLFGQGLARELLESAQGRFEFIAGDVSGKQAHFCELNGADLLCPCEVELRQSLHASQSEPLYEVAMRALALSDARILCVTRANEGLVLFQADRPPVRIPALCVKPVDVLGCGDALLSAMTSMMLGGGDLLQAAYAGSLAAAIEGETPGNIAVSRQQIVQRAQSIAAQQLLNESISAIPMDAGYSN